MSKAKSILLTIGIAVLAIGGVIGIFTGMSVALRPSVQSSLNAAYSIGLPENCELLYRNGKDVSSLSGEGTRYYVFDLTKSGADFAKEYSEGANDWFEDGFQKTFETVTKATAPKEIPVRYLPSFGEEYRWRLVSQTPDGRKEFTGAFDSEEEAREFDFHANVIYIAVQPQTNRLFLLIRTL